MQKWCPEPFAAEAAAHVVPARTQAADYAPDAPVVADGEDPAESARGRVFRREAGFKTPEKLMDQLSREERTLVFDLAEQDVARDYEERQQALRADLEQRTAAEIERMRHETREWATNFGVKHEEALREMAAACARLAVTLAEKIIRARVEQDPEVLVRAIETTLFAVGAGETLTVVVHPDDAAWLAERDDLRQSLHIGEVVSDRRVDRGGCRVSCGDREWDSTLGGQLETLAEVVAEWITTATAPGPEEGGHGPALD